MGDAGMSLAMRGPRNDIMPSKMMAFWALPFDQGLYPQLADWLKCDGNNGTPDMQGYFARGVPVGGDVILEQGESDPECASAVGGAATHAHDPGTYKTPVHAHTMTVYWKGYNQGAPTVAGVYNIDAGTPVIDGSDDTVVTKDRAALDITGTSEVVSGEPPYKNLHYIMRA